MAALLCAAILVIPAGRAHGSGATGPVVRFLDTPGDDGFGTVVVEGLSRDALDLLGRLEGLEWEPILSVFVDAPDGATVPPVLGDRTIEGDLVRFTPRFAFDAGRTYVARFDGSAFDALSSRTRFTMPVPPHGPRTRVEAIYPGSSVLPSNLLRLYVHFSAPMMAKDVQRHVHLFDEAGGEISLPFVEVSSGLWDRGNRRLTLFFHPGRIKRGVAPGEAMGPILRAGSSYRFVIDAAIRDASGEPIGRSFEKRFRTVAPDRRSPDPSEWSITAPIAPEAPVVVSLSEPIDHALLRRLIRVEDGSGEPVGGRVAVGENETRWEMHPERPWAPGDYVIVVHPALEDLAGNTLMHPFDRDASMAREAADDAASFRLRFTVPGA